MQMTEETLDAIIKEVAEAAAKGASFAEIRGISKDELETIYAIGLNNYKAGAYAEAEKVFTALTMMSQANQKYWIALGGARQQQKKYNEAIGAYKVAAFLDLENPTPHQYAADCYKALGNAEMEAQCREAAKVAGK